MKSGWKTKRDKYLKQSWKMQGEGLETIMMMILRTLWPKAQFDKEMAKQDQGAILKKKK